MKLAFLIFRYYPYGGLQRDCLRLANYCAEQGHEAHIFTMQWQGEQPKLVKLHLLPRKGFSNHQRALNFSNTVQPLLLGFDKVIGFDRMQVLDFYFAGDLCFAKTSREKHSFWFQLTARYRGFCKLEQQVFGKTAKTKIFVLTDQVKKTYQDYYQTPNERFILIPPGIKKQDYKSTTILDIKRACKQQLQFKREFNILQVGSDFKRKGIDRSIRAIGALPEELKQKTQLHIIGKGDMTVYRTLIKQLQLTNNINFLGAKDNITDYMLAADFLLHPAYFETAGMVIIEALTYGLPVIVTDNCGYAFHVEKADAGTIISTPFSEVQLSKALLAMLTQNKLDQYAKNALNYAANTDLYSMDERCLAEITR